MPKREQVLKPIAIPRGEYYTLLVLRSSSQFTKELEVASLVWPLETQLDGGQCLTLSESQSETLYLSVAHLLPCN